MKTEQWKEVVGLDGLPAESERIARYYVSDQGRVESVTRWGARHSIAPVMNGRGRMIVTIRNRKKAWCVPIDVLVCLSFLGQRPEGMVVLHKDKDRTNNALSNLCYATEEDLKAQTDWKALKKHLNKPLFCLEDGKMFESISAAAQFLLVDPANISRSCNSGGVRSGGRGLHFQFLKENEDDELQ